MAIDGLWASVRDVEALRCLVLGVVVGAAAALVDWRRLGVIGALPAGSGHVEVVVRRVVVGRDSRVAVVVVASAWATSDVCVWSGRATRVHAGLLEGGHGWGGVQGREKGGHADSGRGHVGQLVIT